MEKHCFTGLDLKLCWGPASFAEKPSGRHVSFERHPINIEASQKDTSCPSLREKSGDFYFNERGQMFFAGIFIVVLLVHRNS